MTVGYRVGSTDLDALFQARSSAAAAATGFKDSSGVDLNSRYEPRGGTTPIGNTGYKIAGGTDLCQVFKGISSIVTTTHTMVAGSGTGNFGYQNNAIVAPAMGSLTPATAGGLEIRGFTWEYGAANEPSLVYLANAGGAQPVPPDADSSWISVTFTGVFQDSGGASVARTLTRASRDFFGGSATVSQWQFRGAKSLAQFINGNSYGVSFTRG
jgi:hypothetical protein